jgi:phage terminase small subunit
MKRPARKRKPKPKHERVPIFTNKQKAWADRFMETGNAKQAAIEAYSLPLDTPDHIKYASCLGSKNKNNPTIKRYMEGSVELATKTITFLAVNADNERVRLSAAQDILDRLGFKAPEKVEIDDRRQLNQEDYEAIRRVQSILSGVKIEEIPFPTEAVIIETNDQRDPLEGTGSPVEPL